MAAICVQSVDVQCVLQFTLVHAAGCVLHRRTSRVIHRLKLCLLSSFFASRGSAAEVPTRKRLAQADQRRHRRTFAGLERFSRKNSLTRKKSNNARCLQSARAGEEENNELGPGRPPGEGRGSLNLRGRVPAAGDESPPGFGAAPLWTSRFPCRTYRQPRPEPLRTRPGIPTGQVPQIAQFQGGAGRPQTVANAGRR